MRIDRAGVPFIAAAVAPAAALPAARRYGACRVVRRARRVLRLFLPRPGPRGPAGRRASPSRPRTDGDARRSGRPRRRRRPATWLQITIFLSPLDVHINRAPVAGRVTRIEYRPGRFLPAYDARAGENELNEIWVDADGTPIVFRQVVGILARRIVCRIVEGQSIGRGERIGLMKFGSRMDVFVPPGTRLCVAGRRSRRRRRDGDCRARRHRCCLACRCGAARATGRSGSSAASSCCRRCSRSATCSAATPASSTRRAATSTRRRYSSASRWCSTRSTASSRG